MRTLDEFNLHQNTGIPLRVNLKLRWAAIKEIKTMLWGELYIAWLVRSAQAFLVDNSTWMSLFHLMYFFVFLFFHPLLFFLILVHHLDKTNEHDVQ